MEHSLTQPHDEGAIVHSTVTWREGGMEGGRMEREGERDNMHTEQTRPKPGQKVGVV